ncbi:MAG: TauD/TfdA family dioxygenase [Betaproteobacteria bacterium]|nr:TauD/TfdA family dioxygenase [Betaproteobacteria bacterium]
MRPQVATTAGNFEVVPSGRALGAEVRGIDLSRELDDSVFAGLRAAWLAHLVLVFRDQRLNDERLMRFSSRFGELEPCPPTSIGPVHIPGQPEIMIVSNVKQDGRPIGILGSGEAAWHTDQSFQTAPPIASALYAMEVPDSGGETSYVNMYAAWEAMPAALRARIQGRFANHDSTYDSTGEINLGRRSFADVREAVGHVQPLVIVHPETGREALFYGRRKNGYVIGLEVPESEALLDDLHAYTTQDRFIFTHHWRVGDLVVWDNRCTMHRRAPFDPNVRRVMHRTQIRGQPVRGAW